VLNLFTPFVGACFGHAMSKVVKYATIDDKVFKDLGVVSIKYAQSLLQACITLPKKSGTLIILILALQAFICCAYVLYN
jgi:sensor histidine kinase regulating citrate/malate metabolism